LRINSENRSKRYGQVLELLSVSEGKLQREKRQIRLNTRQIRFSLKRLVCKFSLLVFLFYLKNINLITLVKSDFLTPHLILLEKKKLGLNKVVLNMTFVIKGIRLGNF
jgi:hypothetical protein